MNYFKAIIAFIVPGVAALVVAVQDGSPGGSTVTFPGEVVAILAAMVLTSAGVYITPPGPGLLTPKVTRRTRTAKKS